MTRTNQNIFLYSGNTKKINTIVRDKSGMVVDLTGVKKLVWVAKLRGMYLATKTLQNGIEIIDAKEGKIVVTIIPADTSGKEGEGEHSLSMLDADNQVSTLMTGSIFIENSIAPDLVADGGDFGSTVTNVIDGGVF